MLFGLSIGMLRSLERPSPSPRRYGQPQAEFDSEGWCPHCGKTPREAALDTLRRIGVAIPYLDDVPRTPGSACNSPTTKGNT